MANDSKIYVGNLPPDSTVRDIEKLFSCYGKITDIDIKNRNGPPFAFIQFDDRRDAEDAVKERDDYDLDGFSLRVEFPKDIKQAKIDYPSYSNYENSSFPQFQHRHHELPMSFNYNHYPGIDRFQYYGNYHRDSYNINNNSNTYQNRKHWISKSGDFRVYLSNLPSYLNWQDVKDFMQRYGEVSYAKIIETGTAICDFFCKEDYNYVLSHLRHIKFKSRLNGSIDSKIKECPIPYLITKYNNFISRRISNSIKISIQQIIYCLIEFLKRFVYLKL